MGKYITAAEIDKLASETGKKLAAQEKVQVMIALDKENPKFRCNINGCPFEFERGKMIEVPKDIAAFIETHANATVAAENLKKSLRNGKA